MKEVLRTHVAGVQYSDYQKATIKAGTQCKLYWEPSNPIDPNAIKIMIGKIKIGYIPRHLTDTLHEYREEGIKLKAEVTAHNKNNPSWSAIHIKVMAPKLLEGTGSDVAL
jgi:hypothetical protein